MRLDGAPVRPTFRHEEARPNRCRIPSQIHPDATGQPALAIERSEKLPGVDELGLELDYQQGTLGRPPAEHVDDATLTPDREGDLGSRDPTQVPEPGGRDLGEARVTTADQSIEIAAPPARRVFEPDLEARGDRPNSTD